MIYRIRRRIGVEITLFYWPVFIHCASYFVQEELQIYRSIFLFYKPTIIGVTAWGAESGVNTRVAQQCSLKLCSRPLSGSSVCNSLLSTVSHSYGYQNRCRFPGLWPISLPLNRPFSLQFSLTTGSIRGFIKAGWISFAPTKFTLPNSKRTASSAVCNSSVSGSEDARS